MLIILDTLMSPLPPDMEDVLTLGVGVCVIEGPLTVCSTSVVVYSGQVCGSISHNVIQRPTFVYTVFKPLTYMALGI